MSLLSWKFRLAACLILLATLASLHAQQSMTPAAVNVNKKMAKLFGIGDTRMPVP